MNFIPDLLRSETNQTNTSSRHPNNIGMERDETTPPVILTSSEHSGDVFSASDVDVSESGPPEAESIDERIAPEQRTDPVPTRDVFEPSLDDLPAEIFSESECS